MRTPSMYSYYEREVEAAYQNDDYERVNYLIGDMPDDIKEALVKNGVLESSVEATRSDLDNDGQPSWEQEWLDFGEVYSDEYEG